jgi:CBS domain-containing protein
MRVKDLMTSTVHVCHERDMLDRPAQIMWDHDCGCVPVVNDDGRIVGMITDRDICMAAHFRGQPITIIPVGTVMARELCTCQPDDQLIDAERLMSSRQVRRLPVVHPDGSLAGILSISDIARRRPRRGGDGARQRTGWNAEIIETISAIWEPRHREPESGVVEDAKKAPARRRLRPPKTEADSEQPQERRH